MAFTSATIAGHSRRWLIIVAVFELCLAAVFLAVGSRAVGARFGMDLAAGILGVVGLGLLIGAKMISWSLSKQARIDATGIPGSATITAVTQTGATLNGNPRLALDVSVQLPGRAAFPARITQFVPLILLSRATPGGTLAVKVDQQDPSKIVVDWDT
jgi:hypothetical protein